MKYYIFYRGANDRSWTKLDNGGYDSKEAASPEKQLLQLRGNDVRVLPEGEKP